MKRRNLLKSVLGFLPVAVLPQVGEYYRYQGNYIQILDNTHYIKLVENEFEVGILRVQNFRDIMLFKRTGKRISWVMFELKKTQILKQIHSYE